MKICLLFVFFPMYMVSQVREVVTPKKGEEITEEYVPEKRSPESTIALFYDNQENISTLDDLITYQFYLHTPFVQFKKIIEDKNKIVGKFLDKNFLKIWSSCDNLHLIYEYEVNYENQKCLEKIELLREKEKNNFEIYCYEFKII